MYIEEIDKKNATQTDIFLKELLLKKITAGSVNSVIVKS